MNPALLTALSISIALLVPVNAIAQDRTPLEEFVDGFPMELEIETRNASYTDLFAGGDISAYFNMRVSEFMETAIIPPRQPAMPLAERPMPEIGAIETETSQGTISLDDYLARSDSYAQAYIVIHKGEVVYEVYPRMRPEDPHVWMSSAKPLTSLLIDILIDEGKIDQDAPITNYLTGWQGTDWDNVTTRDVMDMTSGMDLEDTPDSRLDPTNVARRVYEAEFGFPNEITGEIETLEDVLKSTPRKSPPGEAFEYASGLSQVLVFLAEAVEGERWTQAFDRLVWSKVAAEGALQVHLTPDGIAAVHGLVSGPLRDMARFGMLYTPSWNKTAVEQIVTHDILERIRNESRSHEVFTAGISGPRIAAVVATDEPVRTGRQWDLIWPDGDMWKGGLMTQGLYVSPARDLVIAYFSVNNDDNSLSRFVRPIATSGLFDE